MKIRTGFVSNSSSASFVVALDKITAADALKLMAYTHNGREVLGHIDGASREWVDSWSIDPDYHRGVIRGWTSMDNGDLSEYLEKVGVDTSLFTWEGD